MGRPFLLVDNVLNTRIYPNHTVYASSTAAGTSELQLAGGRRVRGLDLNGWFASALNTEAHVGATFDALRAVNCIYADRDSNLSGEVVRARISDDGFTTFQELGPYTVPSAPAPFTYLYDGYPFLTDEGSMMWWLGLQAGWDVRFVVDAMGTGERPELAGLLIGFGWAPVRAPLKPFDYGNPTLLGSDHRSPHAIAAGGDVGRFRNGPLRVHMSSWIEHAIARPHVDLFTQRRPAVIVHDDEQAERAVFATSELGRSGFVLQDGEYLPDLELQFAETEPVAL